jgi:S1-C subfamily serine protease
MASQDQKRGSSSEAALPVQSPVIPDRSIGAFSDQEPTLRRDGVVLSRVLPAGSADRVGIKVGDTILAIGNHYVFTVEELANEIRHCRPGAKVSIRYRRYATIYDTYLVVGTTDWGRGSETENGVETGAECKDD